MSVTNLDIVILAVRDVERSKRFYVEAFGFPIHVDVPVFVQFTLPDGRWLGIYERESFGINTNQPPTLPPEGELSGAELYFGTDDLGADIERLTAAGARLLSPPELRLWGDEVAYFSDPDGHVLALARHLED